METFTELKALTRNPNFQNQRQQAIAKFDPKVIDSPIVDIVKGFAKLPYCFTLQSCCGHFLYRGQDNPHNLDPVPITDTITKVEYRIAYIALVIEESDSGKMLFEYLNRIPQMDSDFIQFGCADWFWKNQVNSYALQVEPKEHMYKDRTWIDYDEALHLERIRELLFAELRRLLQQRLNT